MPKEKADPRGRKKGTPKTGGRRKGTPNKITALLKEAVIKAAEIVGEDGNGKNGLVGYLCAAAKENIPAFLTLLGKAMPLQLTGGGDDDAPLKFTLQLDEGKE
jgi:hypothetical protein